MNEVGVRNLNDKDVLPGSSHQINQHLIFISVPCTFRTAKQSVDLQVDGVLNKGIDWAALRTDGYAMVSASEIEVVTGNVLWHVINGETVSGGYDRIKAEETNPWLYAAAGAVAGYAVRGSSSSEKNVKQGLGRDRADFTNLSKGSRIFGK